VTQTASSLSDSFAARLSLALKALNVSRARLASAVGVDKSLVSRWLAGQVTPSSHNLARISNVLAQVKPGFNMTLWERPRAEFELFLGLCTAVPIETLAGDVEGALPHETASPGPTEPIPTAIPESRSPVSGWDAWRLAVFGATVALLMAVAATFWFASRANEVLIEPFDVPSELAQRGLTGDVIAAKLLDRLTDLNNETRSVRPGPGFANERSTVLLGRMIENLRSTFGNVRRVSGEVYAIGDRLVLTYRLDGQAGRTFVGKADALDGTIQRAAENIYEAVGKYRYGVYLFYHRRIPEAKAIYQEIADYDPSRIERAWAVIALSRIARLEGRELDERVYAWRAYQLDPDSPSILGHLRGIAWELGHDEDRLEFSRKIDVVLRGPRARDLSPEGVDVALAQTEARTADELGDYVQAAASYSKAGYPVIAAADIAFDHDPVGLEAQLTVLSKRDIEKDTESEAALGFAKAYRAIDVRAWPEALRSLEGIENVKRTSNGNEDSPRTIRRVIGDPWLAYVQAQLGDWQDVAVILKRMPLDCYICTRMRGDIDAIKHNWGGAAYWFGRAIREAPSIPFAYADWGRMLMAKGDRPGAIQKFAVAHAKGPHFGDPLEMWAEALMLEKRSDLAVAKFEEANADAPHWGRLHFKWGEALMYVGRKDKARQQLLLAAQFDLVASDRSELLRLTQTLH
jgi:tetratricopeptide (TPR) repeat protein/transcriptional regulator with XRE-family HTH domain